jgi:hypothetical protein
MRDDRPITAERALLAVKAAGLDPGKPLSEQLDGDQSDDVAKQIAAMNERIDRIAEALSAHGEGGGGQSAPTQPTSAERRFAEGLRDAMPDPGWVTTDSLRGRGRDAA